MRGTVFALQLMAISFIFFYQVSAKSTKRSNINVKSIEQLYQQIRDDFHNLDFPMKINIQRSSENNLVARYPNKLILPKNNPCSNKQMNIQITHELGHLVFSHWYKKQNHDYHKLNRAIEKRTELIHIYDQNQGDKTKLNLLLSQTNKEIKKYGYLFNIVFPLEELFADMFALIYYDSSTVMREGLQCYGAEALERDYSVLAASNYKPTDVYGHSEYIAFGYHYFKLTQSKQYSKSKSIKILYEKILRFISSVNHDTLYNFKTYNKLLREI